MAASPQAVLAAPVALLDADKGLAGPVTWSRWRRALVGYALLFLAGLALAWGSHPQWASFGLGLIVPGGGFLLHVGEASALLHGLFFLGTLLLFVATLILWVATGNLMAPLVLWLGSAGLAASMDHWGDGTPFTAMSTLCRGVVQGEPQAWMSLSLDARVLVPLATLGGIALAGMALARRKPRLAAERDRINRYLTQVPAPRAWPVVAASGLPVVQALREADLPLWRFLLDRSLQPVEAFEGFDRIDEFREAAKRYQICNSAYMLGMQSYTRVPAFRGYLSEAQDRLTRKMMLHPVWSYWRLENLWGNLDANPDPFARDNIMYYGWYGGLLGINLCTLGDERYAQPGSIRLEHPSGMVYRSSFGDICQIIRRNMQASDFALFPCEPRWIYPICNNFGALSLKCHDQVFGTHYWDELSGHYRRGLEQEFVTMNGRITAIRDAYTGMTIPALTATMADAVTALFMHPVLPDIARRSWAIIRHDLIAVANGAVSLRTNGWDQIDFGNYRRSLLSTYALVAASAREMGDDEVADGLLARIDAEFESTVVGGVRHYRGASVGAHTVIHAARVLRGNGFHDLVAKGRPLAWKNGPLLQEANYPEVLVAGAVSDGAALDLTLAPGSGGGRYRLGFSQLRPGQSYRIEGGVQTQLTATPGGTAEAQVDLDRYQCLRLLPLH